MNKIHERKKREINLLIFNLTEEEDEDDNTNIMLHVTVSVLLDNFKLSTKMDVSNVRRMGEKMKVKKRPILLAMDNKDDVLNVIMNWWNLPKHLKESFDHTVTQRQDRTKLQLQADLYNKNNQSG